MIVKETAKERTFDLTGLNQRAMIELMILLNHHLQDGAARVRQGHPPMAEALIELRYEFGRVLFNQTHLPSYEIAKKRKADLLPWSEDWVR